MSQNRKCKGDCGQSYPATTEYFYHNGKGFMSRCKTCHKLYTKEKLYLRRASMTQEEKDKLWLQEKEAKIRREYKALKKDFNV